MELMSGIRGMPDILPEQSPRWQAFRQCWQTVVSAYGYREIGLPIVENTALFKRSIGEVTDIVEKEMFSFQMKEEESLSLRPEGTAGCVRACLEHNLLYHQVQRLWYMGPMFRYERPQKGRYRQFHQVGLEAFGLEGPDIDVEQIALTVRLWKALRVESAVRLEINSLGSQESRASYREQLMQYFSRYESDLDEDSQRRLQTNPLRILDSKNPKMADVIAGAPKSIEALDDASREHFEAFKSQLEALGIEYVVNTQLVRGLDYYNRSVYEWVTDKLGSQSAVCAGGRYDHLVSQLGGSQTPAVGFALGIERLLLLQESLGYSVEDSFDIYLIYSGEGSETAARVLAEKLRDTYRVIVHCGGGGFKQQFKKADKSGARLALVLGEEELKNQTVGIKFLRESLEQDTVHLDTLESWLERYLQKG